jgi:hypothetical protein
MFAICIALRVWLKLGKSRLVRPCFDRQSRPPFLARSCLARLELAAFIYGKKLALWKPIVIGIELGVCKSPDALNIRISRLISAVAAAARRSAVASVD